MPSYTAPNPVSYQLPPTALLSPQATIQWAKSLPAPAQALLTQRTKAILRTLDPASLAALGRYLVSSGVAVPPECGMGGLGDTAAPTANPDAAYAGAFGALIGAAAGIYTGIEANKAQKDIFGNQSATDQSIAQIQANAGVASTQALAAVQGAAAQAANQAAIARSQVHSQTIVTIMPWLAGITGMGVIGFGIWAFLRKKR